MAHRVKSRGYAREWLQLAGLKQADLVNRLNYSKAKAFAVWHGDQRLNEDILEEVADLVRARPYELLLSPEAAHRLRRLEAALRDVNSGTKDNPASPAVVAKPAKLSKSAS